MGQRFEGRMEVRIECIEGVTKGHVYRSKERQILMGRSSSCDLILDGDKDLGVSGRHCVIKVQGNRAILEDCGSTNGTLLAGKPVKKATTLKDGATFRLGRQGPIFRFSTVRENPPTAAEPIQEISENKTNTPSPRSSDGAWKFLFFVSLLVVFVGSSVLIYRHYIG